MFSHQLNTAPLLTLHGEDIHSSKKWWVESLLGLFGSWQYSHTVKILIVGGIMCYVVGCELNFNAVGM